MSGVLRKRNHRLQDIPHASIMGTFFASSLVSLTLLALVVVLGHFFPAR